MMSEKYVYFILVFHREFICIYELGTLKFGLSPSKKFLLVSFNKSSLKMMKNASYFILEALFVLKIFKFLSSRFGHIKEMA